VWKSNRKSRPTAPRGITPQPGGWNSGGRFVVQRRDCWGDVMNPEASEAVQNTWKHLQELEYEKKQ
jgi:hypothetical protein